MAEGGLLNKLMKLLIFPISGDMNRRVDVLRFICRRPEGLV
jgi:hypothetical protein